MSHKNILLVEGEADRAFFEALCQRWQLPVQVKVSTPRDAGHTKDTKQAAFAVLKRSTWANWPMGTSSGWPLPWMQTARPMVVALHAPWPSCTSVFNLPGMNCAPMLRREVCFLHTTMA